MASLPYLCFSFLLFGLGFGASQNTPPIFTKYMKDFRIREDTPPGTTVYNLTAFDAETDVYYGIDKTDVFYADPVTGEVKLMRALDFEADPSLDFVTVVEDFPVNGSEANTVSQPITVRVIDVNDNAPKFLNRLPIQIFLTPDTPSGAILAAVTAVDADTIGEPLTISCQSNALGATQDLCDYFTLRVNYTANATRTLSADLILATRGKELYALNDNEFDLTLSLTDGLFTSAGRVHVTLTGSSENIGVNLDDTPASGQSDSTSFPVPPRFLEETQHSMPDLRFDPPVGVIEITENWPVSFPLPLRPRLINRLNGTVTLTLREISSAGLEGAFSLDPPLATGSDIIEITPLRADVMDRERYPTDMRLEITALHTASGLSAAFPVTIRLLDANDNTPSFQAESYNFTMSDDAEDGQLVGTAEATDADSSQFGVDGLAYAILGPYAKYFRPVVRRSDIVEIHTSIPKVTSSTGDRRPWRQLPENIVLILRATDTNGTGLFTDVPVTVHVARSERHGPVFVHKAYFARLREKSVQLEPPLVVQAYDEDDSTLEFTLDDPTGRVFAIDQHTGAIFVQHPEDVSVANLGHRLQLSALASDGIHPPAKANVTIEIVAVDEKRINRPPHFKTPSYNFVMPAGASDGFVIGNVIAEDPEGTAVRYHLAGGGDGSFKLNVDTGELTFMGSRLVKDDTFVLTVLASDSGSPPAYSSVQLRITAKGLNTVEPKFTDTVYTAYVSENATIGTEVVNLKVIDPDADGAFSFTVRRAVAFDPEGYPVLLAKDGTDLAGYFSFRDTHMILRKSLFEKELSSFHVQVTANDLVHPLEQPAYTLIVLNVVPAMKPHMDTLEFVGIPPSHGNATPVVGTTVPWDIESGGFIYQFHVIEKPITGGVIKPPPVIFTLRNSSEFFAIDATTGIVTATKSLIKAPEKSMLIIEAVHSQSGRMKNAKLIVQVVKPIRQEFFMRTPQFDIQIPEDADVGSFVLHTNTSIVNPSLVRYQLTGPDADFFAVDEMGVVTLVLRLDREKMDTLAFVIEASLLAANGSVVTVASAPVAVTVLDVNDNIPVFQNESYSAVVLENVPVNSYIMHVRATDADLGENGTVGYRLVDVPKVIADYLTIDASEGILMNNRLLIGLAGVYQFAIRAVDGGGLNSTVPVNLTVQQISRCQPVWAKPDANSTILEVQENMPPDQLIGTIRAITEDERCKIKYTFLDISTGQATGFTNEFELNGDSGKISTRIALDREKKSRYTLTVSARDNEPGSLFTIQNVLEVVVKDVNDNEPVFQPPPASTLDCRTFNNKFEECWASQVPKTYNFSIFENAAPGTVLGLLRATDADVGENAKVYYHLAGGRDASMFSLDPQTGILSTKKSLDYETVQRIEAVVVATNEPQLTDSELARLLANMSATNVALVSAEIMDQNDHGPMFDKNVYLAAISNETVPETLVALVHATDPDTIGGGVFYRLRKVAYHYKGSVIVEQGLFSIDPVEGEVKTLRQVGHYSQGYFQLTIDSSNAQNYTSNLSDTTNVKIWIYNPEQLVRIVIRDSPINITDHADIVVRELGNAIGADVLLQRIEYNRDPLGGVSSDKVDLLAVFIDRSTEEIMEIARVLSVVDRQGILLAAASRPDLGVVQVLPAQNIRQGSTGRLSAAAISLIVFGCVMFIGLLGFLLLLCYFRYSLIRDKAEAAMKKPEPPKLPQPAPDYTRKMKENPLWNDVVKKPYEEQELSFPVSLSEDTKKAPLAIMPRQQPSLNEFKGSAVMDITPPYARVYKQQQSSGSTKTSDSGDDYYQTLRTN